MCYLIRRQCSNPRFPAFDHHFSICHFPCAIAASKGISACRTSKPLYVYSPVCGRLCPNCVFQMYPEFYANESNSSNETEAMFYGYPLPHPDDFKRIYNIWDQVCQLYIAQRVAENRDNIFRTNLNCMVIIGIEARSVKFCSQEDLASEYLKRERQNTAQLETWINKRALAQLAECLTKFLTHQEFLEKVGNDIKHEGFYDMVDRAFKSDLKVEDLLKFVPNNYHVLLIIGKYIEKLEKGDQGEKLEQQNGTEDVEMADDNQLINSSIIQESSSNTTEANAEPG